VHRSLLDAWGARCAGSVRANGLLGVTFGTHVRARSVVRNAECQHHHQRGSKKASVPGLSTSAGAQRAIDNVVGAPVADQEGPFGRDRLRPDAHEAEGHEARHDSRVRRFGEQTSDTPEPAAMRPEQWWSAKAVRHSSRGDAP
jgi:hypothetical protein